MMLEKLARTKVRTAEKAHMQIDPAKMHASTWPSVLVISAGLGMYMH
jgi:hypothetical protein